MKRNKIQNDRMFSAAVRLAVEVFVKRRMSVPETQKGESNKDSFSFILVQPYFYLKSYEKPFLIPQFYAQELKKHPSRQPGGQVQENWETKA